MKNKILAWHWVKDDCTLIDGSPLVWHEEPVHKGELVMCQSGYHASFRALDALQYAPGSICCRVEIGGKFILDTDKLVAKKLTVLWAVDAKKILREFARWCALQVIHLWDAPECVRKYLETGDESLRFIAEAAAWAAAWATAWATARATAWDAAWATARATAWDAARAAAWDAARAAAWATAREAQNNKLEEMLEEEWENQWKA